MDFHLGVACTDSLAEPYTGSTAAVLAAPYTDCSFVAVPVAAYMDSVAAPVAAACTDYSALAVAAYMDSLPSDWHFLHSSDDHPSDFAASDPFAPYSPFVRPFA